MRIHTLLQISFLGIILALAPTISQATQNENHNTCASLKKKCDDYCEISKKEDKDVENCIQECGNLVSENGYCQSNIEAFDCNSEITQDKDEAARSCEDHYASHILHCSDKFKSSNPKSKNCFKEADSLWAKPEGFCKQSFDGDRSVVYCGEE